MIENTYLDDGDLVRIEMPLAWILDHIKVRDEKMARDGHEVGRKLMFAFAAYRQHTHEFRSELERLAGEKARLQGPPDEPPPPDNGLLH